MTGRADPRESERQSGACWHCHDQPLPQALIDGRLVNGRCGVCSPLPASLDLDMLEPTNACERCGTPLTAGAPPSAGLGCRACNPCMPT